MQVCPNPNMFQERNSVAYICYYTCDQQMVNGVWIEWHTRKLPNPIKQPTNCTVLCRSVVQWKRVNRQWLSSA